MPAYQRRLLSKLTGGKDEFYTEIVLVVSGKQNAEVGDTQIWFRGYIQAMLELPNICIKDLGIILLLLCIHYHSTTVYLYTLISTY